MRDFIKQARRLSFVILLVMFLAHAGRAQESKVIRVSELSLRRAAINTVMPSYPQEAIGQKATGIAVAELLTDEQGNVVRVNVLEAPHASIKKGLAEALKQWKFRTSSVNGTNIRYVGKLTFYFVIDNQGNATVKNPRVVGQ